MPLSAAFCAPVDTFVGVGTPRRRSASGHLRRLPVIEQTIDAPPLDAPPAPERSAPPSRPSVSELAGKYPWVLAAIGLLLLSLVVVLWGRTRPGYDPYGWLVWGKLTIHLKLDTNGAPSWKPLPFLFTVPFAFVGKYQLWLWMVTSVAISLSGLVFAWRIAFRLTASTPERRYASYAAGLFAAVFVLGLWDSVSHYSYLHYILSAESDTMIVSICLAAIDAHLSGRRRWAFWLWWLGALGRPEVWPYLGIYAVWMWFSTPTYRRWIVAGVVLQPLLWFGIPGLTSKSFFTAGNNAQNSPRELRGNKITGTLSRFRHSEPVPVEIAALLAFCLSAWRWRRSGGRLARLAFWRPENRAAWLTTDWQPRMADATVLVLGAGAALWVLVEIAFALHGFPAVPRYVYEAAAVMCVLAGVFVGRVIRDLPPYLARLAPRFSPRPIGARLAGRLGSWGAVIVIAVLVGSMLPWAHTAYRSERVDLTHERARTVRIGQLRTVVDKIGPASRILACGQPNIPIEYQSIFAWYTGIKVGVLYVSPTYLTSHPHPLVNIYPIAHGWRVFPSHVVTAASRVNCRGLRLTYRS